MFTLETPTQVYARVALTNRLQHLDALRREAQADANAHLAAARLFHKCADDMVTASNAQWNKAWDAHNAMKGNKS